MTRANTNKKKKKQKAVHPRWAELIAKTSFPISALEVLEEHYSTLNNFCANTYGPEVRVEQVSTTGDILDGASTSFELSFHQYCVALSTLIQHGSPIQQFEYMYHTYAATNERGINRSELFQLLKEHSELVTNIVMKEAKLHTTTDPRHFDKLYTWLKKHFILYDESRCEFLSEKSALELLQSHPTALSHLKFQLAPFIKKMKENNTRYTEQAAAALKSE